MNPAYPGIDLEAIPRAGRVARAEVLARIVREALESARLLQASTARIAVDALFAMALATSDVPEARLGAEVLEHLARLAGLPEFEALDYRRKTAQSMTESERADWLRIERFAAMVASAAVAAAPSNCTPGAGPVAAT